MTYECKVETPFQRDVRCETDEVASGEHPSVVLQDICSRPRPNAHIIAFANEKGGVGKSTLAFHTAVALSNAGASVLAMDLDRRQQTLHRTLEAREATARALDAQLPCPIHLVLDKQSGAQLSQEILRVGTGCDVIVLDVAGADSPIARRAIAMADTLVTPVNSSFADLDPLGRFSHVALKLRAEGQFAATVMGLQRERERHGMDRIDWIVARNRTRHCEHRQSSTIDSALSQLEKAVGFRRSEGLAERVAYRELLPYGLTHLDLKSIRGLAGLRARTGGELGTFIRDLNLPPLRGEAARKARKERARFGAGAAENYRNSLEARLGARHTV